MTTNTILLLVLSILIAGGMSFFQYFFKVKTKSNVNLVLAFLRFISIFGILLLLINPIIKRKKFEIFKTPLAIVVDNSSSIFDLKAVETTLDLYKKLSQNKELQEKFDLQSYRFAGDFQQSDEYNFKGTQTNLDNVAKSLKSIYKNTTFPTVLITDGNQTSGGDFIYTFDENNKVYPVIVGDTAKILDFKVSQVNVNKYAFQKNKFPVEVFLNYSGVKSITADFLISQGNSVLTKQRISFSPSKKSVILNVLLPAEKVGLQVYKATISSNQKEKNRYNNIKNFAVEIIDQKTNIAIVSSISHPDVGTLKRAIESNVQRKVTIVKPNIINALQDYNVLILYQPTTEFKSIFDKNKLAHLNTFIISGNHTDFNFLNREQENLFFKMSNQKEDYLASFNTQFNLFAIDNLGFDNFPPLQNPFGTIDTKGIVSTLLSSKIRNIEVKSPLLTFTENQGQRSAILLGENIWKWRLQSHVDNQSFDQFDVFMDKIIQYLASNDAKKSLIVDHESFYNSGEGIEISAQFFNKNYEFDEKARLTISLTNTKTKQIKNYDLLKSNNLFKVKLDGLSAGAYNFSIKELNSKTNYTSQFEILDFDIEKQFVNPDVDRLSQVASLTQGKVYYANQADSLINSLLQNDAYKAIQKENVLKTPLIDWLWLLVLIAISLFAEWFIRKYNGML